MQVRTTRIALLLVCAPLSALAAAPTLDLTLPAQSAYAAPAPSGSSATTAAFVPRGRNAQAPLTETHNKPVVWGSLQTGYGYAKGWGSSAYQAGDINASQAFGQRWNPLVITGGVAGAVGYSKTLGTTQWEGAHVEMSKAFGSPSHPFAFSLGIGVSNTRMLGNGSWFQQPGQP